MYTTFREEENKQNIPLGIQPLPVFLLTAEEVRAFTTEVSGFWKDSGPTMFEHMKSHVGIYSTQCWGE